MELPNAECVLWKSQKSKNKRTYETAHSGLTLTVSRLILAEYYFLHLCHINLIFAKKNPEVSRKISMQHTLSAEVSLPQAKSLKKKTLFYNCCLISHWANHFADKLHTCQMLRFRRPKDSRLPKGFFVFTQNFPTTDGKDCLRQTTQTASRRNREI